MFQLTIVYRVFIDGEWRQGIYRNLFATYAEALLTKQNALDGDDMPLEILEWDIT